LWEENLLGWSTQRGSDLAVQSDEEIAEVVEAKHPSIVGDIS
jgi:hypothetical protein